MPPIGFVIMTHNRPAQALRLVRTLGAMFDSPPIVIHHDFGQSAMPVEEFPPFVRFAQPHVPTRWGAPSLNDAMIKGIADLYSAPSAPDWMMLLSGADYPVKSADHILRDLQECGYDALLRNQLIEPSGTDSFSREMTKRYRKYVSRLYRIDPDLKIRSRTIGLPVWFSRFLLPFSKSYRCYAGSQWFSANRRAAERLLKLHETNPLRDHYWKVPLPDESYVHCLLCNEPDLRIFPENKRVTIMHPDSPHPTTLTCDDLPFLMACDAHFARKFEPDDPVLDRLDEIIGAKSAMVRSHAE